MGGMSETSAVAIVGAGPYGLSVAAHLAAAGVEVRAFGTAMGTWRDGMPRGMFLKSEGFASSLSDPGHSFTLGHHCRERGLAYADVGWPVPVEVFAAYGQAFQRRFVPQLDGRRVVSVARARGGFRIGTEDGDTLQVGRVVMATGIGAFARVPEELADLPEAAMTHSSRHADYSGFAGRDVAEDQAPELVGGAAVHDLVGRVAHLELGPGGRLPDGDLLDAAAHLERPSLAAARAARASAASFSSRARGAGRRGGRIGAAPERKKQRRSDPSQVSPHVPQVAREARGKQWPAAEP